MFLRMHFATCPDIMGLSDYFDKTGPERAAKCTHPTTVWIENKEHIDNIDDTESSNTPIIPELIHYNIIYF